MMLRENSSSSLKNHPNQTAASSDGVVVLPSSLSSGTSGHLTGSPKLITRNGISRQDPSAATGATVTTATTVSSLKFLEEEEQMIRVFDSWSEIEQTAFVESLLGKMSHCQHSQINSFLKPMLQRDFISLLPSTSFIT